MQRGCVARPTTKGATGKLHHPKFSKTCLVVGYKLQTFRLHLEISAGCGPACASGWIIVKSTVSQSSWCTLLRDSIRLNDWSWQWFTVTLARPTDCICSLSWQGTLGNRRSLGRSSVLYSYWQSHHCSQYLWKIGKWPFGIRCGVVEVQNCAHWGCKGVGRIRNDVVAPIKQVASEVVSIPCVIHCEVLVAKKLGNEEEITNWLVPFPGFRAIYYFMVSIGVSSGFRSKLWMQSCPKKSRGFDELVIEMGGDGHFVYHSELWWLSRERVG